MIQYVIVTHPVVSFSASANRLLLQAKKREINGNVGALSYPTLTLIGRCYLRFSLLQLDSYWLQENAPDVIVALAHLE